MFRIDVPANPALRAAIPRASAHHLCPPLRKQVIEENGRKPISEKLPDELSGSE